MYQLFSKISTYVYAGYLSIERSLLKVGRNFVVLAEEIPEGTADGESGTLFGIQDKLQLASNDLTKFLKNIGSSILIALMAWQFLLALVNSEDERVVSKVKKTVMIMLVIFILLQNVEYVVSFIKSMAG